ncbi:MAG: HIT family protein [Candidatus Marinimicrobia bacterium]|nr:HIT family protein [Candidatus Neomarinimicrobiota bacterium]
MREPDCIFCRIVAGEIPCTRLFEDEQVLAFMDIGPIIKGHALVIPKAHYDPITAVPPAVLAPLLTAVQRVARAQQVGLGAEGINVIQNNGAVAGQAVKHVHFHVIPRFAADGHHWNWNPKAYRDEIELQTFAERLRQALATP